LINALTIDVEDYFQVAAFNDNISRDQWENIECRVERNTEVFLEMTEARGIKATFFTLGWIAERYPALVRKIADAGHEVASHGYSHKLIYTQSPEEFRQETERSKKILEDLSQQSVDGYRAASYSITEESIWALDIISELGFKYDSSIYPVRHDRYGLRGGPHSPYIIQLKGGNTLKEFPITTVDILSYKLPVGGGGYFRLFPFELTKRFLLLRQKQLKAPFVFYLHPWELDPEQPRVSDASALSRFRHYNNLDRVQSRLNRLFDLFDFSTMRHVFDSMSDLQTHRYD
jgi:polysaccharide deacetylase family protein (PEP-CTERM system associated)